MLNTEQIKMPQSKLQNTGYQPVEALFSFIASCCAVSHRLQLRPRQISVYKRLTGTVRLTATYPSVDLELSHVSLALRRGGGRARARGGVYVEANPDLPFYLPRHIGRDE